jgi:rhodanese-related sulfurtransferase
MNGYTSDLTPQEAWDLLAGDQRALLVDVRTEAEWRYVGVPDTDGAAKRNGLDAAVARIASNGGQVLMGPHEVPGGSWIVQAVDPQGAAFALVSTRR